MSVETSLRRPDFLEGVAIRLADGQCWTVPVPGNPARDDPQAESREVDASVYGPAYAEALEAVREAEDGTDALRAELALAICLLRRNYNLDPPTLSAILSFSDAESLSRMQRAMSDVATAHLRVIRPRSRRSEGTSAERISRSSPIKAFSS